MCREPRLAWATSTSFPRTLILDVGVGALNKASIQSFRERGMNAARDDYLLMDLDNAEYFGGRLTATFFERRLEMYGAWYGGASKLHSIRDRGRQRDRRGAGRVPPALAHHHIRDTHRSDRRRMTIPGAGSVSP